MKVKMIVMMAALVMVASVNAAPEACGDVVNYKTTCGDTTTSAGATGAAPIFLAVNDMPATGMTGAKSDKTTEPTSDNFNTCFTK